MGRLKEWFRSPAGGDSSRGFGTYAIREGESSWDVGGRVLIN